jgi:hypothetical protein
VRAGDPAAGADGVGLGVRPWDDLRLATDPIPDVEIEAGLVAGRGANTLNPSFLGTPESPFDWAAAADVTKSIATNAAATTLVIRAFVYRAGPAAIGAGLSLRILVISGAMSINRSGVTRRDGFSPGTRMIIGMRWTSSCAPP